MNYILNIETSTKNCSVSLSESGKIIAIAEAAEANFSHAEKLHFYIETVLKKGGISLQNLSAIAVSKGPGSYTGLRIGVSSAKGLAYALNLPLIGIDTLLVLARSVHANKGELIIPMIDARRMEVFTAVFDSEFNYVTPVHSMVLKEDSLDAYPQKLLCVGDSQVKTATVLKQSNICFYPEINFPSAKEMASLSFEAFINQKFEDIAYFEPFYLKDFYTG